MSLRCQMKYLAISKQRLLSPITVTFGLNPRATAELRWKSFTTTLTRESHVIRLFQKELVFGKFQNKWSKCSGSFSQKLHLSESLFPILFKKVLVAICLCMSLKWKVMIFVHFEFDDPVIRTMKHCSFLIISLVFIFKMFLQNFSNNKNIKAWLQNTLK